MPMHDPRDGCLNACAGRLPLVMDAAELDARIDVAVEWAAEDKSPPRIQALEHLLQLRASDGGLA